MLLLMHRSTALLCRSDHGSILAPVRAAVHPSPALDILMNSQQMLVLDHADEELANLCSSISTPQEQAECWEVWKFYHDRRQQMQSGCMRELEAEGRGGSACQSLDSLERLVYEVAFSGDAEQLYHMLKIQNNIEKKRGAASAADHAVIQDKQAVLDSLRAKALDLFRQMDADGNGVIDREEFLNAMSLLHRALGDHEMELAFSCMDSNGYITPEQFVGIVQAEELCDPASDAEILRHTKHARPSWWSEAPHCITDV